MELSEVFVDDGPLASVLDSYRHRPEQSRMAAAVADSIAMGSHLAVEAGTGIGKTYAYLVPILLGGQRAIVSTGTKTLQDQLYLRDLPVLSRAIGRPVTVALLKGRNNYLCRYRLALHREDPEVSAKDQRSLGEVADWSQYTKRGDLTELAWLDDASRLRNMVSSTRDNCLQSECPNFEQCHVVKARREAAAADVVVVNHHLLLADLVLRESGFAELLPQADVVVVDEAHQLPELAQLVFSVSVSSRQIDNLLKDVLAEVQSSGVASLSESAQDLRRLLTETLVVARSVGNRVPWTALSREFLKGIDRVDEALSAFCEELKDAEELSVGLEKCWERAVAISGSLDSLLNRDHEEFLKWAELGMNRFTLHQTPMAPGVQLGEKIAAQGGAWIFASATLAVGERFDLFLDNVGVDDAETLVLDSPFDFQTNARLVLLDGLPDPRDGGYIEAFISQVVPLIEASGGGAFLLFTSHRALNEARDVLTATDLGEIPLFFQGDGSRTELLRGFRTAGNGVLLGTASFWQGVDVRGNALRLVAIDKLPFAPPTDPLVRARVEHIERRGGRAFPEFQLPHAVLTLKQGVGRLIRDFTDRGVIVLGDPRLKTKRYGREFINGLPSMPLVSEQEAAQFLASLGGTASAERAAAS